jgi:hypothetical protein
MSGARRAARLGQHPALAKKGPARLVAAAGPVSVTERGYWQPAPAALKRKRHAGVVSPNARAGIALACDLDRN